jgi:hypothetical protein
MWKYNDDDSEKGGKEISFWEHLERSGFVQSVKEKGFPIFPSHDSELRKAHKQEAFEKALNAFKNDRTIKKLQTTEEDKKAFRVMWLNNEIQITEKLISGNASNSDSLELSKYLNFVQTEWEALINQKEYPKAKKRTLKADHYVLAYLFESTAKNESWPIGQRKELESIGRKRMPNKSGNTFYKSFQRLNNLKIHELQTLFSIAGDDWREIVLELSTDRHAVDAYLKSKGL